jgi:ABC-type Fe3+ transport system substrate-binding protein
VFAENRASAEAFLDFLASADGRAIWAKYGYFATPEDAKVHAPNATIEPLA